MRPDMTDKLKGPKPELYRVLVFDTETTGLPPKEGGRFVSPKDYKKYNDCRIVQIAWQYMIDGKTIRRYNFCIKPNGFVYTGSQFNKVTKEMTDMGTDMTEVMKTFKRDLGRSQVICGHNVWFDIYILQAELYRLGLTDIINMMRGQHIVCTMRTACKVFKKNKWPKLVDLYKYLTREAMINAHDADADVEATAVCYRHLFQCGGVDRPIKIAQEDEVEGSFMLMDNAL